MLARLFKSSILRYLGVGGTAFVMDLLVTVVTRMVLLATTPLAAQMATALAVAAGYWSGFAVNYLGQRNFAFKSYANRLYSLIMYFVLVGFNWLATTVAMIALVDHLGLSATLGKIICTAVTTVWNYPIYRYVVFPRRLQVAQAQPRELPGAIDVIIPAHNSVTVLEGTLARLAAWSRGRRVPMRAIVVENASHDGTAELLEGLALTYGPSLYDGVDIFTVEAVASAKGMGRAYRRGISVSTAPLVVFSADDLPFGTSDLDYWWAHPTVGLAIGSKAHPDSQVDRGMARAAISAVFRLMRRVILGSKVGDPQGTLFIDGDWIRAHRSLLVENGYLSSTEIVALAEHDGQMPITEMPVVLTADQGAHATRIKVRDVWNMAWGLVAIRRRMRRLP